MRINKSGSTDPAMMIHGGSVIVSSEGLILHTPNLQELEHPPAVVDSKELVTTRELNTIHTETRAARLKRLLFEDGYIVHVGAAAYACVAAATVVSFSLWVADIAAAVLGNLAAITTNVTTALAVIIGIGYLMRGGKGPQYALAKPCPRSGATGPIKVPLS